ncbi:MAG: hypothetical protein M1482_17360 [Chloroflexi bacterium]|nr:hypothetical protein [Chloroflexota bacterium]
MMDPNSKLYCRAPCGLVQLCLIACPNNRVLDEGKSAVCMAESSDEPDQAFQVEFAAHNCDGYGQGRSGAVPGQAASL